MIPASSRRLLRSAALLSLAAAIAACSPGEFDDLADQTWVHRTGRPDTVNASNWATDIAAVRPGQSGLRLAVLGDAPASVGLQAFSANGELTTTAQEARNFVPTQGDTDPQIGTASPAILRTAYSPIAGATGAAKIAIGLPGTAAAGSELGTIAIIGGGARLDIQSPVLLATAPGSQVQGLGKVVRFANTDAKWGNDGAPDTGAEDLIALGNRRVVVYADVGKSADDQRTCFVDEPRAYQLITADLSAANLGEEIIVMGGASNLEEEGAAASTLYVMTASTVRRANPTAGEAGVECFDGASRVALLRIPAPEDSGVGSPTFGLAMVTGDFNGDDEIDLAVGDPGAKKVYVYYSVDADAKDEITTPDDTIEAPTGAVTFAETLAAGNLVETSANPGADELVVGDSDATAGGETKAGRVHIYRYDGATLEPSTPDDAQTLYAGDAKFGQDFGRALVVTEYGAGYVLAVAAKGEVFTYFRTSADAPELRN